MQLFLSRCTDFSQIKIVWECSQFFWMLLIQLHIIFHVCQWKTGVFGEKDTHLLFIACVREVGMPFRKGGVPEGRVLLPYVRLQKKCINVLLPKAIQKSSVFFFLFFFPFLLIRKGAVKCLFFGGHCVLVARLIFLLEMCRYSIFFGTWATMLLILFFNKVKSPSPWLILLTVGKALLSRRFGVPFLF